MTLANLVSGTGNEGYYHALDNMAESFDLAPPSKSSFSEYRQKISYTFFKNTFNEIISDFKPNMKTYRGYHIVAFDGDQYDLPPYKSILNNKYRGYPVGKDSETHYLKMYTVRCVDLLSSVVLNFEKSFKNDEISLAIPMIEGLPKNTISIYDRLYLSKRLIDAHLEIDRPFLARCKSGSTFKEITNFYNSNKRRSFFYYNEIKIHLIKVKNPKGKDIVLATNICVTGWTNKELTNLYNYRWECETSNRDSTTTLKLEQWHTKFYNGILQEIYVHLILLNLTKITIFLEGGFKVNIKTNETQKSNFKFLYSVVLKSIYKILKGLIAPILRKLKFNINRTIEKRKKLSRSYPRELKKKRKTYRNASVVARRS